MKSAAASRAFRVQPVERLGNVAERHRTRVGTMRITKIDQEPLAAIGLVGHSASVLVDEREVPADRGGCLLRRRRNRRRRSGSQRHHGEDPR